MLFRSTKALVTWKTKPCIADVWPEPIKDKIHAHQKPFGLQKAVIEATTEPGDVVIDPVAGSFSVMHAAHACGRRFLGGDILGAEAEIFGEQILTGEADRLWLGIGPTGPTGEALHLLRRMGGSVGQVTHRELVSGPTGTAILPVA